MTEAPQQEQPNAANAPNAEQHSTTKSTVANMPVEKELNTWHATARQRQLSEAFAATLAMPPSSPPTEQASMGLAARSQKPLADAKRRRTKVLHLQLLASAQALDMVLNDATESNAGIICSYNGPDPGECHASPNLLNASKLDATTW